MSRTISFGASKPNGAGFPVFNFKIRMPSLACVLLLLKQDHGHRNLRYLIYRIFKISHTDSLASQIYTLKLRQL